MREHNITIKELASLLNVSTSTVSKALNNSPEISDETRERIQKFAKSKNYVPNTTAQNLRSRKTKTIGVIVPDILPNFFAQSVYGIEKSARKRGYKVIFSLSNESIKEERESIKTLINGQVDGVIMSLSRETQSTMDTEHLKALIDRKIPLLLFDRVINELKCDKVVINDAVQAEQATELLRDIGCKTIGYFSSISDTSVDTQRKLGYSKAIKKSNQSGITINIEPTKLTPLTIDSLIVKNKIDGILASDEVSAILIIKNAMELGIKVPQELSVIGFTNGSMSEYFTPSLTCVDQQAQKQGEIALNTIVDRIEGKLTDNLTEITLETSIIKRQSTQR